MREPKPAAPRMPRSYGAPTDASGATSLPWSWADGQLASARNYWVDTVRGDGRPHSAPVWGVWLDGELWFSTDPVSQKGRNVERDDRSLVHLESGDDVVILDGRVTKTSWPDDVINAYEAKYSFRLDPSNESYGTYVFRPRTAQTWTERNFPQSAARWIFDP